MARDNSPIVKQSRREGYALHPKAHKIMARKSGIPGVHAHGRQGKPSLYLTQLREKQKVRRLYGLLEKQFAKLMNEATRQPGLTGENLLRMLEQRIDNAVYRAGFAGKRFADVFEREHKDSCCVFRRPVAIKSLLQSRKAV